MRRDRGLAGNPKTDALASAPAHRGPEGSDGVTRQHREDGRGDDDAELGEIGKNVEHQCAKIGKAKALAAVIGASIFAATPVELVLLGWMTEPQAAKTPQGARRSGALIKCGWFRRSRL